MAFSFLLDLQYMQAGWGVIRLRFCSGHGVAACKIVITSGGSTKSRDMTIRIVLDHCSIADDSSEMKKGDRVALVWMLGITWDAPS